MPKYGIQLHITSENTYVVVQLVAVLVIPVDASISSHCPNLNAIFVNASVRIAGTPARIIHCDVTTRGYPNEMRFRFEISTTRPYDHRATALPNHIWDKQLLLYI